MSEWVNHKGLSDAEIEDKFPRMADKYKKSFEAAKIRMTQEDIKLALEICNGNLTEAAKMLDTTRPVLARKVQNSPGLQRQLQNLVEQKLDYTEDKLMELVNDGNVTAITFLLRTRGKERGYTEKNLLEHSTDESSRNAAALIEQMRKGAKEEPKLLELGEDEWEVK
jgi:hypothetical protein